MTPLQHDKWTPLTTAELKAYMGFSIFMGIVKLPSIENYWRRDVQFHYSPIASKISRDRFRDIRRYLHFTDNTTLPTPGTPGSDRLAKVRPLFNKINERCSAAYNLGREVAVDEAMIKYRLAKVRPLFNKINERCSAAYNLGREVAVDEAMIKFQGRSPLKQYLPNKPVKRGIKVWVLADIFVGGVWSGWGVVGGCVGVCGVGGGVVCGVCGGDMHT